jgi:predicted nucleic acid-binding protein
MYHTEELVWLEKGSLLPYHMMGAICIFLKIELITRNSKDFDPQRHAFVEIPYQI